MPQKIIGYKVVSIGLNDLIPVDAKYISPIKKIIGEGNLITGSQIITVGHTIQIPVYKPK